MAWPRQQEAYRRIAMCPVLDIPSIRDISFIHLAFLRGPPPLTSYLQNEGWSNQASLKGLLHEMS